LLLLAAGFAWYVSVLIGIYAYSSETVSSAADAAIVLGAAVWDTRPSPVFEERIKHAIDLYERGDVRALIFTGGLGQGDRLAESQVAKEYATARGVPAEHIFVEAVSTITAENLNEAGRIVDQQGFSRVLIVSDPLHMKRAVTMARDLGMDAHPSPTPTSRYVTWRSKLGFLLREGYYYGGYLLARTFIAGDWR
jgi:uncharacterized SAM-binding protein YcdF (DUF218 family)